MKKISIGEYMRNARLAKNMTVEEVSKALEIPVQYITIMEHDQFKILREDKLKKYLISYGNYLEIDCALLLESYKSPNFEIEVEEIEEKGKQEEAKQSVSKRKRQGIVSFNALISSNGKLSLVILSLLLFLIIGVVGTVTYFKVNLKAKTSSIPSSSLQKSSQAEVLSSSQSILTTSVKNSNMTVILNSGGGSVTIEISQDSDEANLVRVTNSDLMKKGQLLSGDTKAVTATVKSHVDRAVIMLDKIDNVTVKINGQQLDLSGMSANTSGYITLILK